MVLLRSRDCAGGAGPAVEICAPDVPGAANGADAVPALGAAKLGVAAGCEVAVVVGKENGLAEGAEVVTGCEAAVVAAVGSVKGLDEAAVVVAGCEAEVVAVPNENGLAEGAEVVGG